MNKKAVDYIIVGQGLAGSCLAVQLLQQKKRIAVWDVPVVHAASRVAAGLFNPVTGKQYSTTWLADQLFPYLHAFYQDAERITQKKFYHSMPVYRPFASVTDQNEWMGKRFDETYVESIFVSPVFDDQVHNPFGGLLLKNCGYLNTTAFLSAVRDFIYSQSIFEEDFFHGEELVIHQDNVRYREYEAARVIFCGGISANQDRFFSWLPIRPLKGEVLQLDAHPHVHRIYNRGVYLVPGVWKAGATYNRADSTTGATPGGLAELKAGLDSLIRFPYQIIGQLWGMRPTVPDRRPILGAHPEFNNIVIFNGLGTKGVSLAPYFSNHLVQWLENGGALNNAVDIQRYKSLYWKSA